MKAFARAMRWWLFVAIAGSLLAIAAACSRARASEKDGIAALIPFGQPRLFAGAPAARRFTTTTRLPSVAPFTTLRVTHTPAGKGWYRLTAGRTVFWSALRNALELPDHATGLSDAVVEVQPGGPLQVSRVFSAAFTARLPRYAEPVNFVQSCRRKEGVFHCNRIVRLSSGRTTEHWSFELVWRRDLGAFVVLSMVNDGGGEYRLLRTYRH